MQCKLPAADLHPKILQAVQDAQRILFFGVTIPFRYLINTLIVLQALPRHTSAL